MCANTGQLHPPSSTPAPAFPLPLGGGKLKAAPPSASTSAPSPHPAAAGIPARKKPGPVSAEEEELTNIPSLQMRVRILQQRVSCVKYLQILFVIYLL